MAFSKVNSNCLAHRVSVRVAFNSLIAHFPLSLILDDSLANLYDICLNRIIDSSLFTQRMYSATPLSFNSLYLGLTVERLWDGDLGIRRPAALVSKLVNRREEVRG